MPNDLTPVQIDLNAKKRGNLNEFFAQAFGNQVEILLRQMFGQSGLPNVKVKGTAEQIKSFSKSLGSEKRYMDAYQQFGLDNPRTLKSKYELDTAIKDFERSTGITWPLK